MDIIKAINLKKYYTSDTYEVRALDGVPLTVEDGEFIAVVGTSGCGKTTLMNILGGLDTPDFGGVWIRNTSLKDLNKEERTIFRRRNIGFVFQQYNLIPSLSIRENIVLPMRLDGKEIDIDFFNISILSVDGVQFEVYSKILDAMEIPWVVRTDNDISNISTGPNAAPIMQRQLSGFNRCLSLSGKEKLPHKAIPYSANDSLVDETWKSVSDQVNPIGLFISKIDLETDLGMEMPAELIAFKGPNLSDGINYLQKHKAIRMREFLVQHSDALKKIGGGELARPLYFCVDKAMSVI